MRKVFFILIFAFKLQAQNCSIVYDNIEDYDWTGAGWAVGYPTTGFYNNASVTPTLSAVLYGTGNGTSNIEQGFYILPSVTPISAAYSHILTFRLASYRFTSPTGTAAGVDVSDYLDVQVSTNTGPYITELRITGNNNAYWTYASTAAATKTISGTLTTLTPVAGGDRTSTGDGYSYISLTIPAGPTQVAFRLYGRVNAAGEEWWIDNIDFTQLAPCVSLPVELLTFTGENYDDYNKLDWSTATETNNNYFKLERSNNGLNWSVLSIINGNGTTSMRNDYQYKDYDYKRQSINYYKLSQTDFDGKTKSFDIISINSKINKIFLCENYLYYDMLGKEVNFEFAPKGFYLKRCGNVIEKIMKL